MALQSIAVRSLHKGLLPVSCFWPVFPYFNFAFNNICSAGTRQSIFHHIYFIITTRSHLCCLSSGNTYYKIEVLRYIYCRIIVDNFFVFLLLFRVPLIFKTIELRYNNISSCIVPYIFRYLNLNTVNFVLSIVKTKQSAQNALGNNAAGVFARQTPSWCADLNSCDPLILAN